MEERELISKIRELRQIKPNRDWVALTKSQILGEEINQRRVLIFRPVYAGLIFVFVLFGIFSFAQNSLPGDLLYPIKKLTEKSQAVFVSEEEKPKVQLELANKRVEELKKIAETNQVQKLAPAIKEVKNSVSQATKNLIKSEKTNKDTVDKIVNLKKNLEKAENTLTTMVLTEEEKENLQEVEKGYAEMLIKDFEKRTLTEEQENLLAEAKEDFENSDYSSALEKLLLLSQNNL